MWCNDFRAVGDVVKRVVSGFSDTYKSPICDGLLLAETPWLDCVGVQCVITANAILAAGPIPGTCVVTNPSQVKIVGVVVARDASGAPEPAQ